MTNENDQNGSQSAGALVPVAADAGGKPALGRPHPVGGENPVVAYLAGLPSPASRRSMGESLDLLCGLAGAPKPEGWTSDPGVHAAAFPWWGFDYAKTNAMRAKLLERYKPRTASRHLAALRGVLRAAKRLGLMSAEAFDRATDLPPIKIYKKGKPGRMLADAEIESALEVFRSEAIRDVHDAAVFAIAVGGGLRRAEIAALRVQDYGRDDGSIFVAHGKGGKERTTYLPEPARPLVERWLKVRAATRPSDPLFCRIHKSGKISGERFTPKTINDKVKSLAERAKLGALTPHDLRRTFISRLLAAGVDLSVAAELSGHESTDTTAGYDRRGDDAKKAAIAKIQFPTKEG